MPRTKKVITLCCVIYWLVCILIAKGAAAQEKDPCLDKQTQYALNVCEADQYAKADVELNAVYSQLIAKHKSDAEFVKKLRLAQESWLKFRDADLASIYYQDDKPGVYGSVHPMCRSMVLARLTIERTKELKEMLNREEGDVCASL
jgi:uncharacterized protein YecT (DUF1311 family)